MVDLQGPARASYSVEEKKAIGEKFSYLVHSFLLFYLFLHNLFLPLVINAFRGNPPLDNVHFWFLFQFPVHLWLRKGERVPSSYLLFLFFGSLSRLIFYAVTSTWASWTLVSVYLSEVSSLIFFFLIQGSTRRGPGLLLSPLGAVVPLALLSLEIVGGPERLFPLEKASVTSYRGLGCQGSSFVVTQSSVSQATPIPLGRIVGCGFEANSYKTGVLFSLANQSKYNLNLRLYELARREGRFTWKFKRILRLGQGQTITLKDDLKKAVPYLLKSPERRWLGMTVLLPEATSIPGKFDFNFDGLSWGKDE